MDFFYFTIFVLKQISCFLCFSSSNMNAHVDCWNFEKSTKYVIKGGKSLRGMLRCTRKHHNMTLNMKQHNTDGTKMTRNMYQQKQKSSEYYEINKSHSENQTLTRNQSKNATLIFKCSPSYKQLFTNFIHLISSSSVQLTESSLCERVISFSQRPQRVLHPATPHRPR